jgi:hypothetical protein
MKTNLRAGIAGLTLVGTLSVAGAAAAADSVSAPATGGDRGGRAAQVCEHLDEIDARVATHLETIAQRQARLIERRAEADAAGRHRLVERIDRVTARLAERTAAMQERIERLDAWAAEHCEAAVTAS